MSKFVNGQRYNTDFFPIDDEGNVIGDKDLGASESWTNTNEPWRNTPGWHGQPLTPEQEAGIKKTNPTGFAERQAWRAANPWQAYGPDGKTPVGGYGGGSVSGLIGDPRPTPGLLGPDVRQTSGLSESVMQKLLSELGRTGEVDQNDPAYQQQVESFRFNADRTADRQRAATAQRMAAQGTLSGGGLDTAVQRITGDQGAAESAFESGLLDRFRQQDLDRMGRALQLGTGLMSQEQEQALRAALTREGFDLQRLLGLGDLNFRRDALGQQLALSQAGLDQQALLALLGA